MTTIRKSLAVLSVLILAAPFQRADQAAAAGGGSDHYNRNKSIVRFNESYYRSPAASTLPGNCVAVTYGGVAYQKCGNFWMQPRYRGSKVVYVQVKRPF
jgi:hypothetical protein